MPSELVIHLIKKEQELGEALQPEVLEAQLTAKTELVREQATELVRLRQELDLAHSRAEEASQKIELLERENAEILGVLEGINRSIGWRLVRRFQSLKSRLLAPGTLRRSLYERWLTHFKRPSATLTFRTAEESATLRREAAIPTPTDDFWQAQLVVLNVPNVLEAGKAGAATATITNVGQSRWVAATKESDWRGSVRLSYHWYSDTGKIVQWEGERTELPHDLGPSDSATIEMRIFAPFQAGTYDLEVGLVAEGVAWFDQKGNAGVRSRVEVKPSRTHLLGFPACSIIIPVFGRAKFTKACLQAIERSVSAEKVPFEIIVVDNGSTDETPDLLSSLSSERTNVRVARFRENLGFSRACNEGARLACGHYLIFLNNDTLPTPGWLEKMAGLARRDAGIGIVGCKLLYPNGRIQHVGIAFDQNKNPRHIYRGFSADIPPATVCRDYQAVTGACLLMERELYWSIGGMDETFKNSYEDVDLCLKVRSRGYRVVVCSDSVVYHFEGMSEGRCASDFRNLAIFKARWDNQIDCDDERWNALDKIREESNEFETYRGYDPAQERRLKDLWERIYSCPFPN
jgi:GT2 family glycosyltransferase